MKTGRIKKQFSLFPHRDEENKRSYFDRRPFFQGRRCLAQY